MNSSLPSIAGVVLTLNEEHNLHTALSSLSWCDELLVLDSGSTDKTESIARLHGAQFQVHKQQPPFLITDQRNWAVQRCGLKSQWILFLDADEEIGPHLRQVILEKLSTESKYEAYELAPRFWFFGRWLRFTQQYPCWHPRLLMRGKGSFTGGVWESFTPTVNVGRIHQPYEHYAFSKGTDDWIHRHLRYADYEAHSIVEFLSTRTPSAFKTPRLRHLRIISARLWFFRPLMRLIQKYLLNLGFLDGWQGFVYAVLMFIYDCITVIKVIELRSK